MRGQSDDHGRMILDDGKKIDPKTTKQRRGAGMLYLFGVFMTDLIVYSEKYTALFRFHHGDITCEDTKNSLPAGYHML